MISHINVHDSKDADYSNEKCKKHVIVNYIKKKVCME